MVQSLSIPVVAGTIRWLGVGAHDTLLDRIRLRKVGMEGMDGYDGEFSYSLMIDDDR